MSNPRDTLLTPKFALLLSATGMFGLSFSAYFLLPKFLATELQADAGMIGGISAVSMLASVIFMPIIGVRVDRQGRKVFALSGALIFALTSIGFLFVDSVGPLLWILRLFQGAAFTMFYVSWSTLATDISPPARLGQAIGLFGAVMISTNALGPALAEWAAETFSWTAVFAATAVLSALAAILIFLTKEPPHNRAHSDSGSMLEVVKRPGMRRVMLAAVLVGCTMGAMFTFYQPWALSLGYEQVASYLIAFAFFAMVVRLGLGSMADRLGRLRVATVALFLYIATPFALIWVDVFGLFFAGAFLGLSHGVFFPALNAVAVDYARMSERGKAMAAYHGAFNIGFAAGSYFFGYLALATSYPVIFYVAAGTCFAAFLLLVTAPRKAMASEG